MYITPQGDLSLTPTTEGEAGEHPLSTDEMIADIHRKVSQIHDFASQAFAAITEMQESGGGVMGMMLKMMRAGK